MTQELWDGRYKIERTLGEGGMGQVVMARDGAQGDRYVAVKLLSPEHRDHTTDFMREYSMQRGLNHPAIPLVYAFGFGRRRGREVPYFVMDYVRGVPLSSALLTMTDPSQAWLWMVQVLRGLDHTHRAGLLHRDLKPGNIIVTPRGADEDNAASLIDFGIAINFDATPEELFIGTPEYSGPDLMAGAPFEVRQDLYAIGLLLYEILMNRRPWPGDDPTDLYHKRMYTPYPPITSPHCPPRLARLIADLLHPRPDHRPESAAVVIERLCDAVLLRVGIETSHAFHRRLLAKPFEMQTDMRKGADGWLGRTRPSRPVLVLENPPGWDGPAVAHGLTDEAAVGGARIIRYALERRRHRPLEAIRPALEVLGALREKRPGDDGLFAQTGDDTRRDLASAATLLSRVDGPTVIAIDHLEWADSPSIELMLAVLTGARNPGVRIIASWDPTAPAQATAALDRLLQADITTVVRRPALSIESVTDWIDGALGNEAIPDVGIMRLHERSEGKPERVRGLLAEEMRRGALHRTVDGFVWHGTPTDHLGFGAELAPGARETLVVRAAEIDEPVPESVVLLFLDITPDELRRAVENRVLATETPGHYAGHEDIRLSINPSAGGDPRLARERLARSVELAMPFPGQSERAAREWLKAARPLRAAPCLLAAAQDALANGLRDQGDGGLRAAQLLENAGRVLERCRQGTLEGAELDALESLEREVDRAAVRLAQARGRHEDWSRAAANLYLRGLQSGHTATIEVALEAQLQLAMDFGDRAAVRDQLATIRAARVSEDGSLNAWAEAWLDHFDGKPAAATKRLLAFPREPLEPRRQLLLSLLEGEIALDSARLEAAERAFTRAYATAERTRNERAMLLVLLGRVRLLRLQHRPGRARELCADVVRQLGDRRAYRLDGRVSLESARILIALGRPDDALECCERAKTFARRDKDYECLSLELVVRAEAQAEAGCHDACTATLKDAMGAGFGGAPRRTRRETELRVIEASLRHSATTQARRAADERTRATETARVLASATEAEGYRDLSCAALALCVEGALNANACEMAAEYLTELEARLNRWGDVGIPWHTFWYLQSEAEKASGGDGKRPLKLARSAVARLGALITGDDRVSWLEARPQARVLAREKKPVVKP